MIVELRHPTGYHHHLSTMLVVKAVWSFAAEDVSCNLSDIL